jgi:hypothetical protein
VVVPAPTAVVAAGAGVAAGAAATGAATTNDATASCELSCVFQPGANARSVTVYVPVAAVVGTCHVTGYDRASPGVNV